MKKSTRLFLPTTATFQALLLFGGCQTFQSEPLDLPAHADVWRAQNPSSEKVSTFAKRLADTSPDAPPFNPVNGLSLSEGEIVALVFNPELRVARLRAGVAKATAEHAGRWDDPEVSIDVLKISQSVPEPWILGSTISVTLPLSGRLGAEKARAEAAAHAELDRVAEEEWKVLKDLRNTWVSWSAQRLRLEETREVVKALESIAKSTSQLVEQGELLRTESALFTIEQTSRRAEIDRLTGEVAAQEQEIRSLMGLSPGAPLRLVSTLVAVDSAPDGEQPDKTNPTLARLRSEYEVAEGVLLREVRKQYPDLTIGPQAEEDQGQTRIGFVGAFPLPILNSNKGGIAEARAEREVARAAFETEYERIMGRLATLRARMNAMQAQRRTIDRTLVPLVDRQVADAGRLVEMGEGSSLILLESLVRSHEAKLKLIDIQLQYSQGKNDLRFLLGPTNRNTISR